MENEKKDQVPEETEVEEPKEETTEEPQEEPSEEPEKEPITLEKTHALAEALQKGYTLTRQDLSAIKQNIEAVQEALTNLGKKDDYGEEDQPLTVKTLLKLQNEQKQKDVREQQRVNEMIEGQVNELKARGVIHSKEEEDELMSYAVKHKITDLFRAADIWLELQEAKKIGGKAVAQAKNKVKQEEGSKVGTSQKTKTEAEQGFNYEEIHTKSMDELAAGE